MKISYPTYFQGHIRFYDEPPFHLTLWNKLYKGLRLEMKNNDDVMGLGLKVGL